MGTRLLVVPQVWLSNRSVLPGTNWPKLQSEIAPVNVSSRVAWIGAFLMAVALFYAPLAYGCTRPEMLPVLYGLLGAFIVAGLAGFWADRRFNSVPRLALFCVLALLIQGWWMTGNPIFSSIVSASGGMVDTTEENIRRLSFDSMVLTSFSLVSFLVLCGLMTQARPRRFILLAAALSGTVVCLLGDVLKIAGEPLMRYFWTATDLSWNNFALYAYQGNAGAFLNLVWPLILVFTRRAYTPTVSTGRRVLWTIGTVACGAALFLNASKAALVIGLLILPWPFLSRMRRMRRKYVVLLGAGTLLLVVAGLVSSEHFVRETAFQRMTNTREVAESWGGRVEAYRQYVNALPTVGAFGLGPGLFQLAFPYQESPLGMRTVGLREFAHEDYLQTVLEWGWAGTALWSLLAAGGIYRAIRSYAQRTRFTSKTERHLLLAALLGVGGTLTQALIDFPLQIASIRLFFLVLLALCWASPHLLEKPVSVKKPRRRYRLPIPAEVAAGTTNSR